MAANPRRISRIEVTLDFSINPDEKTKTILEHTARTCPVLMSLHPEVEKEIIFHWR